MKLLVTGATGFIGSRLVEELTGSGHRVVVLSRDPERARSRLRGIEAAFAWDAQFVPEKRVFEGVEGVVHLAGESVNGRWTKAKKERIERSRVAGTHNLVEGMRAAGLAGTFVCASA